MAVSRFHLYEARYKGKFETRYRFDFKGLAGRQGFEPRYADPESSGLIVNEEYQRISLADSGKVRQNPQRRRNSQNRWSD